MEKIKYITLTSLLGILFILNIVIKNEKANNYDVDLGSIALIAQANADFGGGEPASCLQAETNQQNKSKKWGKKCYRDQPGPDVYEGRVKTCPYSGPGCQPQSCKTNIQGCYIQ